MCPTCRSSRSSLEERLYPEVLSNGHSEFEKFKSTVNNALKAQHKRGAYDHVEVRMFTWKKNDLALKAPEKRGSVIIDETLALKKVLEDDWGFTAIHYEIPSERSQKQLGAYITQLDNELQEKYENGERVLLIVYYDGHGDMLNRELIWSA
jgi:hypothetical protein